MEVKNEFAAGKIVKSANINIQEVTDEELKLINKFALSPLTKEDIFSFKVAICDNEVDRDYERFSIKALQQFKKLFEGKTLIKDHSPKADNQVARIYSTELKETKTLTLIGEPYTQLIAKCYMVKTEENKSLIAEIKGGIKKEVSVCCSVGKAICSVCGIDNRQSTCRHYHGRTYEKNGNSVVCSFLLDDAKDAYEVSFVAIPAQRNAGACKTYGEKPCFENETEKTKKSENEDSELRLKIKIHESFIFSKNQKAKYSKEELK